MNKKKLIKCNCCQQTCKEDLVSEFIRKNTCKKICIDCFKTLVCNGCYYSKKDIHIKQCSECKINYSTNCGCLTINNNTSKNIFVENKYPKIYTCNACEKNKYK